MPSTFRAVATVAGCAAITGATLVVTAGPSAAVPPTHDHELRALARRCRYVGQDRWDLHPGRVNAASSSAPLPLRRSAARLSPRRLSSRRCRPARTRASSRRRSPRRRAHPRRRSSPSTRRLRKHTKLALAVSKSSVTSPGKIGVTATLTSAGHAVKGLAVGLEHQTRGSSTWHHVSGAATQHTSHSGSVHWSVAPPCPGGLPCRLRRHQGLRRHHIERPVRRCPPAAEPAPAVEQ